MNTVTQINNFLRYLSLHGISQKSLKYYKSDISSFLTWAEDRKVNRNLVMEYINSQRMITPASTLNRRLSTLRSYSTFLGQDVMSGIENVSNLKDLGSNKFRVQKSSPYKTLQDFIISKFEKRPKIQNLFSKLFFNRPNWYRRYHSYPLATYIHIAILILFTSISGYAVYDQVFYSADRSLAFPTNLTRPNRYLSFQGRLTDNLGNPKTVATNMVFKLYSVDTGGVALWDSGTCSITPDQDGIFSTLLGSSCGSEIASSVFSENAAVWLGATMGADAEATPRVQIATVAYALNAETLQGFPAGTGTSTIPYINSSGSLVLANASPKIQSTSGTFAVEGQALTITTPNASDGIITINPDGVGTLDLTFEGAAPGLSANGFVNATNANITSGSLYSGTVASNTTGYYFVNYLSGSSPTSKFSVDDAGNIITAGDLTVSGGNINTGNIALTIGDATTDSITLQTDGTGNGEVVLPNDSIGPNEILSTGQTDEYCLTYEATGTTWEWQTCGTGGGGGAWSDLTAPTANLSLNMAAYTTAFDWTSTGALDAWTNNFNNNSTSSTTQNAMVINNAAVGSFTDTATENLILLQQLDTTAAGTTTLTNALKIDSAANSGITNGVNITNSAGDITTGINIADTAGGTITTGIALSGTFTTGIDAGNSIIVNIGNSGTDFTSSGGLNLASDLALAGGNISDSSDEVDINDDLAISGILQVGGTSALTYSRFGSATTNHSGNISSSADILLQDMEVDGTFFLDGGTISNSAGTATIVLSSAPTTTANTLSASNWFVDNTANVGQAALMVNQQKSGDLFTASSSGTPKFTIHNDGSITLASDIASTTNTTEGTIFYDNNSAGSASTDHLFLYGSDTAWHRIALDMTKYTQTNASVANQSYIEIAHNQNTNDLNLTGWVYDTISGLWKKISDFSHTIKHALQNEFDDASAKSFSIDTSNTLMNNLVAYWTMDESSSTAATQVSRYDSYGSNTLTDNRSATSYILSATGKVSNSADLELSNGNFLEVADNNALSTGDIDYTLSAWVKLESESAGTNQEVILSKSDSAAVREYKVNYTGDSSDRFAYSIYESGGTSVCSVSANNFGAVTTGVWYHIFAWHDSVANTCNISINNGTADSASETGTPSDTAANFRIGAEFSTEGSFFDGLIDEVGFWKKALTSQERTDIYNSGNANSYATHSNLVRTQTKATDIELTQTVNTGTGADGAITISSDTNINTTNSILGRSCADGGDAVNYSVSSLTSNTATLESAPSTGCLNPGDEVLLINMRGTYTAFPNVGNYETLRVASVVSSTVTFTTSKSKYYGDGAADDSNIGLASSNQAVMLQRVPNYTNVTTTTSNTDFIPSEWVAPTGSANNGAGEGGVMFFRATGTVTVGASTTINANAKGYIGSTNAVGGEGICGAGGASGVAGAGGGGSNTGAVGYCGGGGGSNVVAGAAGSASSGGAGGGGGAARGGGGGAGYGTAGTGGGDGGVTGGTNTSGAGGGGVGNGGGGGGGTTGNDALTTLLLGSAGGGGASNIIGPGGDGGGIIYIATNSLTVSGGIQSNAVAGTADTSNGGAGGGAGGSIKLEGNTITVGASIVTASGGAGGDGLNTKDGGTGGSGRIAVNYTASVSGTTSPSATTTLVGYNTYGLYHSPVIATPNSVNLESIRWQAPIVPYGKVSFQTRTGATSSPTDGTWEAWKPFTVTTNYLDINTANTHTDWTNANTLAVSEGDVTRNVDQFEDEDESTSTNVAKLYSSGFQTDTSGTMATSLAAYWTMNETSATAGTQVTRNDSYSTNHLTDNRSATSYILSGTGKVGNAADLELSNGNFFEKADNSELSTGNIDFTISAWVNLETNATEENIVTKNDSASVREYTLAYSGASSVFRFSVYNSAGTQIGTVDASTFGAASTGTWYFVTAWHDATNNTVSIKINNGTTDSSAETVGENVADTAANFRIGARFSTETAFFDGLIDEVGFWKKVLTAQEITELYNSGSGNTYATSGQYAQASVSSKDLSSYDYVTFWVRASQTGSTVKFGMGESAATEQEETVSIDAADTWQKVYWDLSDIQSGSRDAITLLRFTNLSSSANTIYIDNIRAEKLLTDQNHSTITSTPNSYLQYRIILTTTNTAYQPMVENIQLTYNDGYKIQQTDANTVRLYNYSGSTQQLRLDAVVFGADLAEWYTVSDPSIQAGDTVSLSGNLDEFGVPILKKSEGANDKNLVGVISTKAGQTLGIEAENRRLLALAGRVPVKIDPSSPSIKVGDELTSSPFTGFATLAMPGERVIGKATENWISGGDKNSLLILVNNSYAPHATTFKSQAYRYIYDTKELVDETTQRVISDVGAFAMIISPQIKTNIITPVADSDLIIDLSPEESSASRLVIKGVDDQEVASIDATGKVTSTSLEVSNDATVSGTLYANNIESERLNQIENLLSEVESNQSLLSESQNWSVNTATSSANINELVANNIFVTGNASVSSLFVSDNLTAKSIDSIGGDVLSIQSLALAPLEIMAGKIKIDTNGDVIFAGNVEFAGNIKLNGNFVVANDINPESTTSAQVTEGQINSNSTAGKATLKASSSEIKIINPKVDANSLIYVTPVTSTQNKVLYVKSKDTGEFTVGFSDSLDTDVEFNWWIIKLDNI